MASAPPAAQQAPMAAPAPPTLPPGAAPPAGALLISLAAPAPEGAGPASLLGPLGDLKSGRGGTSEGEEAYSPAASDLGGEVGTAPQAPLDPTAGVLGSADSMAPPASAPAPTPPAVGGSVWDVGSALFMGNAQALTQAIQAAGTSTAAISISRNLQLNPADSLPTLAESLGGPEPGASAVARAVAGAWQLLVCQTPASGQDSTAYALTSGGPLAAAAARGLARAAAVCCSKVAGHLAGAATSLEAGPDFVGDLEAALAAGGAQLPACAVPAQLAG